MAWLVVACRDLSFAEVSFAVVGLIFGVVFRVFEDVILEVMTPKTRNP